MHVLEAIRTRKSIRAFTDQPVNRETIEQLLEVSQRAPSGTNTQPWYVHVCTGAVKDAITEDVLALAARGESKGYEDYDYYPTKWKDMHRDRRRGVGWALYGLLGIQKGDREGSARQGARNFKFFDAPVGLFVTIDSYLARGNWADVGMYIQTLMLAAKGMGLDSCPMIGFDQEAVAKLVNLPADHCIGPMVAIGKGTKEPWPKPGQLPMSEVVVTDRFPA